jgi:ribosome-associated protein
MTKAKDAAALCDLITASLDDDKADDIVRIDLAGKSSFADYMVVASGRSARHVSSIASKLAERLKESGNAPLSVEGQDSADWVLIDAGDVIVHLFRPETREYYHIEEMWNVPMPVLAEVKPETVH